MCWSQKCAFSFWHLEEHSGYQIVWIHRKIWVWQQWFKYMHIQKLLLQCGTGGGGVGSSALEFCLRHLIVCIIFNSRMMLPHVWLICALVPSMYLPFFNFHAAKQQHISSGLSLNGFVACPHTYLTNYLNMSFGVLCCLICYRFAGTTVVLWCVPGSQPCLYFLLC